MSAAGWRSSAGEESAQCPHTASLVSTLFPQSRGPRRRAGSASRPGSRCGAGRSSGSRSPGTGVVAVTVAALTRRTVRAGPCPPLAGSPPAPWAWHSRRWSDIMPGRRCLSHPSAAVVGAARLMLQGANSHRGTALPARPAVGSGSDEPGRPDRRNLGCPAWALSVGGSDDSSEAFSGGGEFVFELFGAALGGVGLSCAGVAFGEELSVRGF